MSGIKVVAPAVPMRRLIALHLGTAAFSGLNFLLRDRLSVSPGGGTSFYVGVIVATLLVIPAVLVALSWREQRLGYALLEAIMVWGGVAAAMGVCIWLEEGMTASGNASAILLLLPVYVGFRLIGMILVKALFVTLVLQDGTMCRRCGYHLTGNTSGICPECGTPVKGSSELAGAARE